MFQLVMVELGQNALLHAVNFATEGTGNSLFSGDAGTRSGPFLEGQHLGFFAGALAIVCLGRKAWFGMVWCLWASLYSQSTTALIGLVVAAGIAIVFRLSFRAIMATGVGTIAAAFAVQVFPAAREFTTFQLAKLGLFGFDNNYDFATLSMDLRDVKTTIAFQMMGDYPATGVGPGRFGAYFFDYPLSNELPNYYYTSDHRAIAENAYAQVAAESGVIMLGLLVILLAVLFWRNQTAHVSVFALVGYIGVGILTQSSWTFIPIWVLIAYASTASTPRARLKTAARSDVAAGTGHPLL
ncbi:O-antigen ligase [Arthrobacter sp. PAMC 25486]|uniref:O-antigen ligase family protein n=1 Tax=Arthrobacter sp. PAMC 25486 TaxID=1494608 RepID=UPI000571AC0F|nr:O-antigen ligase family protein [Arthrobacter sp. PAMC 25486]